eukprot:2722272-Lingulodinium_polyedra.AAC.2
MCIRDRSSAAISQNKIAALDPGVTAWPKSRLSYIAQNDVRRAANLKTASTHLDGPETLCM